MTYNEIKDLDDAFRTLDSRKTGIVNTHDIIKVLKDAKQDKAVEKLEKLLEKNKYLTNGDFAYSDFVMATLDKKQILNDDILRDVYYLLSKVNII